MTEICGVAPATMSTSDAPAAPQPSIPVGPLAEADAAQFHDSGYLPLPAFLSDAFVDELREEVDVWVDSGLRAASIACTKASSLEPPPVMEIDMDAHGRLASHPPLLAILAQLLGPDFAFHHMHSDRHSPGMTSKEWHHDYEQSPQRSRSHVMVHVLHYLSGLNGTVGDLVVLPGSQHIVAEKNALAWMGTKRVAGEVRIDDLPPGSTVLVNSALFHARRARPGGDCDRYFVDASYCQCGVQWPVVKPFWRKMLAEARALGLDRDEFPMLFDERSFCAPPTLWPAATADGPGQPRPT